ncbi:MAG: hypothetical protein U1F76_16485 [Candidatus Competibacteraceae bacterium]
MNWNQTDANWPHFQEAVRQRWNKLTAEHIEEISGERDQLALKLQELYNIDDEEAERQLQEWEADFWTGA